MKNWRTSIGGSLVSIGAALQLSADSKMKTIGVVVGAIGGLFLGLMAKDKNVTGGKIQQ